MGIQDNTGYKQLDNEWHSCFFFHVHQVYHYIDDGLRIVTSVVLYSCTVPEQKKTTISSTETLSNYEFIHASHDASWTVQLASPPSSWKDLHKQTHIWRFPNVGVAPNHPFQERIFHEIINHPAIGLPSCQETPMFAHSNCYIVNNNQPPTFSVPWSRPPHSADLRGAVLARQQFLCLMSVCVQPSSWGDWPSFGAVATDVTLSFFMEKQKHHPLDGF